MSLVLYYELSTIVLRVQDDIGLQDLFNTAQSLTLGLYLRRTFTTWEQNDKILLKCPAAIIQMRCLALWVGLSCQYKDLTKMLLGSKYVEVFGGK